MAALLLPPLPGLRVGEAIALDDGDVDCLRGILVIRKAKFGKSREVPQREPAG